MPALPKARLPHSVAAPKPCKANCEIAAPPLDPDAVLASIRETIGRMDDAIDRVSDAADRAQVRLAISMGASPEQAEQIEARLSAKQATKKAARDGAKPPPIPEGPAAPVKRPAVGWKAPQDAHTRFKALQDGAPPAP